MKVLRTWALDLMMALFFAALGLFLNFVTASAQTVDTGTRGSGLWNVAGNWSTGVVPNSGVPAGSTYNVIINGSTRASDGGGISPAHPARRGGDCGTRPQD